MNLIRITTLDQAELEPYRTLRELTRHWRGGHFVAEGEKVVLRLLSSPLPVHSVLCGDGWLPRLEEPLERPDRRDVPVFVAPDALLESVVGFSLHKRLMAIGGIPQVPGLDDIGPVPGVHVAVEGIADAENMGVIIRACAGMGAASLLSGADSTSPWLRRSVRVSVGAVFALPLPRCDDVCGTLEQLRREHGWRLVATTPRGGLPVIEPSSGPVCLVLGSEADGLSRRMLDLCDAQFSIPMARGIDSLNVANAAGIALYAALNSRAR